MVFHRSLSDSKSPQVSRTRLRILAVLSNAVIWIVSTRLPTSKSSRPFNNPLVILPNAPITFGTIVTFMFHSFFNSLARSRYLSFFSLSFRFILWSAGTAKSTILQILFFLLLLFIIMRSDLLAGIRWSVCILKSHWSLCESFSRTDAGLCIYHLFVWSNWNFLHISQWITLPTQSCLTLYSFCAIIIIIIIIIHLRRCGSLSVSKCPQVTRTLQSVRAYLNNAVAWKVSSLPLISNSPQAFLQAFMDRSKCTNNGW